MRDTHTFTECVGVTDQPDYKHWPLYFTGQYVDSYVKASRQIIVWLLTIFHFLCNLWYMFSCPPCASKALPKEYRATADSLFPPNGYPEGKGPTLKAIESFANILGISKDYKRLQKSGLSEADLLNHFQNNLDLLIQKTWVEKADELRKEKLLDKIPPFISLIEKGAYPDALREFGLILEELAYLLFSTQSQKDDFSEYVLRIDTEMGLFWWYGGQIKSNREAAWVNTTDKNIIYAMLLLGICYLTNF